MRKILFTIIACIFLISMLQAEINLGFIKKDDCLKLYQSCPTCTYSAIRIMKYPNGTLENTNWSMTKNTTDFTYEFCNTSQLGTYTYIVYGDKGGLSYESSEEGYFEVTPSGTEFSSALSIPVFIPMVIMIMIAIFFFILMGFVSKKEYRLTLLIFSGIFVVFSLVFGIMASREILAGFPLLYNFINSFSKIFIILLRVVGILLPIIVAFFVIKRVFSSRGYNVGEVK